MLRREGGERTRIGLSDTIQDVLRLLHSEILGESVQFQTHMEFDGPVLADRTQIQQVVLNLVMNAAEAKRSPGRGHVVVTTRRSENGHAVLLEVADDGQGIPRENLDRIFDPFFTTKEEGRSLGLGLSVVYGIVEAHGGTIDVHSVMGQGTTFSVRLPLAVENGLPATGDGPGAAPVA
jgi:two-component system NtrC family sensor kinase